MSLQIRAFVQVGLVGKKITVAKASEVLTTGGAAIARHSSAWGHAFARKATPVRAQVFMLANFEIEHAYNWHDWTWEMEYDEFVEAVIRLCVINANFQDEQVLHSDQAAHPPGSGSLRAKGHSAARAG